MMRSIFHVTPILMLVSSLVGCAHLNDPYKDSSAVVNDHMTTVSADSYKADDRQYAPPRRDWRPASVFFEDGTVTHWPLAFEDPFEDKGNRVTTPEDRDDPDNVFAWNGIDYLAIAYSPARMLLNTVAFPVSVAVAAPCPLQASDGHISKQLISYDHDAQPVDPATTEPPDYNDLTKKTSAFEDQPDVVEAQPVTPPAADK